MTPNPPVPHDGSAATSGATRPSGRSAPPGSPSSPLPPPPIWLRFAWVGVGLGLLSSGWTRWIASGTGSTFGGLDLADVLRSNVFIPDVGDVVATVIYLVVGSGGVVIATSAVGNPWVVVARGFVCVLGAALFGVLGVSGSLPWRLWGVGAVVAGLSFLVGTTLTTVQLSRLVRMRSATPSRRPAS